MLRVTMLGEQPHAPSAGAESWPVLVEANSSIHKHFWLTVNFPAIAPGTPGVSSGPLRGRFERMQQRHYGMKLMAYTLLNLREVCGV
jgi:hypothetical protein